MLVGKGGEGLVRAQEVTGGRISSGSPRAQSRSCTRQSPGSKLSVSCGGTRDLADYLIPTATDFPKVRAIALENHRSPSNPFGVKGAGGGAIIPIGGLMANAVANALASFGAMPNQLPLSPARVWHMSSAKQSIGSSG